MSFLKFIENTPVFPAHESKSLPERLISGDPNFKTWEQDSSCGGMISTGVWETTAGEWCSMKGKNFEFCYIVSGSGELIPEGGMPAAYKAGDAFVMKPGWVGTWRAIEKTRKIFVIVSG